MKYGPLLIVDDLERIHDGRSLVLGVACAHEELGVDQWLPHARHALLFHLHGDLARRLAHPGREAAQLDVLVDEDVAIGDLDAVYQRRHDGNG